MRRAREETITMSVLGQEEGQLSYPVGVALLDGDGIFLTKSKGHKSNVQIS